MLQNPGEVFSYGNVAQTPLTTRSFELSPALLDRLAADLGTQSVSFPELVVDRAHGTYLAGLTKQTLQSFEEPASQLERESRLLTLVTEAIRLCAAKPHPEPSLGREHRAVALVKCYLREHYSENPTLDTLSRLTGLSRGYLLEVFKRDIGLSPHEYLTCVRVNRVKDLLCRGVPIAQVAYTTGFVDQSHLNRVFKKYVLVTPGQYQHAVADPNFIQDKEFVYT